MDRAVGGQNVVARMLAILLRLLRGDHVELGSMFAGVEDLGIVS